MIRRALVVFAVLFVPVSPARGTETLSPLHVVQRHIVDVDGRTVLLRGVNVNQLGDYYQPNPDYPSTVPLDVTQFDGIARLGMNVVRLIVHWSLLEPSAGEIDETYVAKIRQAVDWASARGIYTVLDMHQDAWGKYIATPPGETCLPGFSRAVGWDGAPQWATLTDALPTCRLLLREVSPAVAQAAESFWIDRDGIQSHLVNVWARLASEFASDAAVAGYDLMNEPHPGWVLGHSELTFLGLYYRRALDAIRAAETEAMGFHHIVFFEPMDHWSATSAGFSPEPFTLDPDIVFAPHLYAQSLTVDHAIGHDVITIKDGFDEADRESMRYGTTFWSGEWGWFGGNPDLDHIAEYARQEDAHLVGGAWWQWLQACGDPHSIGTQGGDPPARTDSLRRMDCTTGDIAEPTPSIAHILSRPYVRAGPGLAMLEADPDTRVLRIEGDGTGTLDVWMPGTTVPSAPDGATVTSVDGGFRVLVPVAGSYHVVLS
jgi:endoglycosylceramidase